MGEVTICRLGPDEWAAYRELRLESLLREPQAFGASYEAERDRAEAFWRDRLSEALRGETAWSVFARDGDSLIGMSGAVLREGRAIVVSTYVREAARGQGLGRRLVEALLQDVGRSEPTWFDLWVNRDQTAAIALYKSCGFQVIDEVEGKMGDGQTRGEYHMRRPTKLSA